MAAAADAFATLGAKLAIHRNSAALQIFEQAKSSGDALAMAMARALQLSESAPSWEERHGALLLATSLAPLASREFRERTLSVGVCSRAPTAASSGSGCISRASELATAQPLTCSPLCAALACTEHSESLLRSAAVSFIEQLAKLDGIAVGAVLFPHVLALFARGADAQRQVDALSKSGGAAHVGPVEGSSSPRCSGLAALSQADSRQLVQLDSQSRRLLETALMLVQRLARAMCGERSTFIKPALWDATLTAVCHSNRVIREQALQALTELLRGADPAVVHETLPQALPAIRRGLLDVWSSVRYAAIQASQAAVEVCAVEARSVTARNLLPPLFLNRHFVDDGVRSRAEGVCSSLWPDGGLGEAKHLTNELATLVLVEASSDHHGSREAALRLAADLVRSHDRAILVRSARELLLKAIVALGDQSAAVRDAACVLIALLVEAFPEPLRADLEAIYAALLDRLGDSSPELRTAAASALGRLARVYGVESLGFLLAEARSRIPLWRQQPSERSERGGNASPRRAPGSRSPRASSPCRELGGHLQRGDSPAAVRPVAEPWERCAGGICLLVEIISQQPHLFGELFPLLAEVATGARHFPAHPLLLASIWHALPRLAAAVGKREFMRSIELFVEPLCYSLECYDRGAASAAIECYRALSKLVGPRILRGRFTDEQAACLRRSGVLENE